MTSGASAVGEPVGVFWDLENCGLPAAHRALRSAAAIGGVGCGGTAGPVVPEQVASNVRDFARRYGRVVSFHAYSDPHGSGLAPDKRLALQQSGVRLNDIPNHRKEAADKAIIVDICMFAVEYKVPATIILISGDRDFANALQRLNQYGYTIVVVSIYNGGAVPNALKYVSKGNIVHDWQALALHGCRALDLPGIQPTPGAHQSLPPPPPPPMPRPLSAPTSSHPRQPFAPVNRAPAQPAATKSTVTSAAGTPRASGLAAPTSASCKPSSYGQQPGSASSYGHPLPPQCVAAVKDYWTARPDVKSVQHPYHDFVAFLAQHPKCGGYKTWGYSKLTHLLMDAQAAGLVWLRPGTVHDAATGQPFAEIAPVANQNGNIGNPGHVLYWLALGFSQQEAKECVQQVHRKAWEDAVVGKLASNSPTFDKELHARWYFDRAGMNSFAVRSARQGVGAAGKSQAAPAIQVADKPVASGESSPQEATAAASNPGSIPTGSSTEARVVASHGNRRSFPPQCADAIADFWKSRPRNKAVPHPYEDFVSHLSQHPKCGGYKTWGYQKLTGFLRDAQAAGLVWLRPGAVMDAVKGEPFLEIAPAAKKDFCNPCHVLYWLALGFSQQEARDCVQLVNRSAWADKVVGKLASSSPHFDKRLHARWYFDHGGVPLPVRPTQQAARPPSKAPAAPESIVADEDSASQRSPSLEAAAAGSTDDSIGARVVSFLGEGPQFPPECADAIADFWGSRPHKEPVQYPYTGFALFLEQHPRCGGHRRWGYSKLGPFLRDAQAAGLLWLRPGTANGQPEIALAANSDVRNPYHVLYWLALGFSQQEAKGCVRVVQHRAWADEVVGKLASCSPRFDKELHARWYFDRAGREAWAVRTMQQQETAGGGSVAVSDDSACTSPGSKDGSASWASEGSLPGFPVRSWWLALESLDGLQRDSCIRVVGLDDKDPPPCDTRPCDTRTILVNAGAGPPTLSATPPAAPLRQLGAAARPDGKAKRADNGCTIC